MSGRGLDSEGLFVQGAILHEQAGGLILLRGAAVHGAAQGGQGGLVVARLHVDHAQLPVGIGVGGVKGEGFLGVAGGDEELTLLGVGLGDGDVRVGVLDPQLLVDGGGFFEVLQGGGVQLISSGQLAVAETDAQVEEGEVGGDLGGLDVLIDGVAVVAPALPSTVPMTRWVSIESGASSTAWVAYCLAWSHFCWSSSTSA